MYKQNKYKKKMVLKTCELELHTPTVRANGKANQTKMFNGKTFF